jgi:hypothetical protein
MSLEETNRRQLRLRSGLKFRLGNQRLNVDCRILCVSEGKCLVGVEGQTRSVCVDHLRAWWTRLNDI